jgi:predicted transposase/invertase (TIGR01784 family)
MQIIFVELPKWKKLNKFDINKTQDRWLMYFTEPTLFDRLSKEEYARYKEISEAMESLENKNFTPEQIYGYELYLDSIHQYHTTMSIERQEGREEGRQEGIEKMKKNLESALTDLKEGNSIEEVATRYDLELPYVDMLYRQFVAK